MPPRGLWPRLLRSRPPCPRVPSRACARSDPSRFFGDRIDLVLDEHELGLHGRELPGELFVLGDELLEEGDYAFDVLVGFHVSENGACRKDIPTPVRVRQEGADYPLAGRGGGRSAGFFKREYSLASAWAESVRTMYS